MNAVRRPPHEEVPAAQQTGDAFFAGGRSARALATEVEIVARWTWKPTISSDGVASLVARFARRDRDDGGQP
jgi:hypothetical protein